MSGIEKGLQLARNTKIRANNQLLRRNLYLPENVATKATEIVSLIDALLIQADPLRDALHPVHGAVTPLIVKARFAAFKELMRAEIARSDLVGPHGVPGVHPVSPVEPSGSD